MRSNPVAWTAADYLTRTRPDEFCEVAPPGATISDRHFMRQQAARIIRSPKLAREQRATIERVWLSDAPVRLRVAS